MNALRLLTVIPFLLLAGCVPWTVAPGADPAVVFAEQTSKQALDTFDTFLKFERTHEAALLKINPKIHAAAEEIRKHGPTWLAELRASTKAYKANRTDTNKTALLAAQQLLDIAIAEIKAHMIEAQAGL